MASDSAYLNLNLYANTNPNFDRKVIERLFRISQKDAQYVTDEEGILVRSVLNSFEIFGNFPAKLRDNISRDINVVEYMPNDVLCTYGDKASSAILILNGKVNLFRPFKVKTFEVKDVSKKKDGADFLEQMGQSGSILKNSGTVMDLGSKVNCESIDEHIFDLESENPTEGLNSREIAKYYRQATAVAVEKTICAIVTRHDYNRAKDEYEEEERVIRMKMVRLIKGFGKHIFSKYFIHTKEDLDILQEFVSTWKHVQYKANTIITKENRRVDRLILIVRGDCKSVKRQHNNDETGAKKPSKLLEVDQFGRHELAAGIMEITNGARQNIPLYKLRYATSLITSKSMCEVYEIPSANFYQLCVHPKFGKNIINFCKVYFNVAWNTEQKNLTHLQEYNTWMDKRKRICKKNVMENERSKAVIAKTRQDWQFTGGTYNPSEDYHYKDQLEMLMKQKKKKKKRKKDYSNRNAILKSQSLPTIIHNTVSVDMNIEMSVDDSNNNNLNGPESNTVAVEMKKKKKKKKHNPNHDFGGHTSSYDIDEKQLLELRKHFGFTAKNNKTISKKQRSLLGISLPTLVSKAQKQKNKVRDEVARKLYIKRKKIGRLYEPKALRYYDPEKDEIKGMTWH